SKNMDILEKFLEKEGKIIEGEFLPASKK
ncbi:MAG: hypothetical protein QG583_382, partial [Patescibacteria group bacterium]|nr:hypothetical protein [Patescibacteria group bacterium]